jgi:hypothetical protein
MGEKIESKGKQDIDVDDRDNPFPVKGGHDEWKEKKAHNQDQSGENKVACLLPGRDRIDPFCPYFDGPIDPLFSSLSAVQAGAPFDKGCLKFGFNLEFEI